jgi:uncharacterized BrkB/YihY/UPF0761 family membrane protein
MKKNIKFWVGVSSLCYIFSVTVVSAQSTSNQSSGILNSNSTLTTVIDSILGIFDNLVPLLIGAAVIVFLYGVLVFIAKASAGNADGRKEGVNFMIYGLIGIVVMVSVWGLVAFVTNTLGTTTNVVPQFNNK